MPLPHFPGRSQNNATSTRESVATPPFGEAPPLEAPTGNSTALGSSAEETEAASSAWGNLSAGQASSEPTWGEDEVSDKGFFTFEER